MSYFNMGYMCFHKIILRSQECSDYVHCKAVVDFHSQEANNEYSVKWMPQAITISFT